MDANAPIPQAAREFFEQARSLEVNAPRKHHLVPASYLRRWEESGRLRITDLDSEATWLTSAAKALRDTDFYSLEPEDLDPSDVPPLLMETLYARLESEARPALDNLIATAGPFSPDDRFALTNLMAFQFTRGRALREEMKFLSNEFFKVKYTNLSEDGIRAELIRRGATPTSELVAGSKQLLEDIRDGRKWVEPQRAQLAHQAAEHALELAPFLFERAWVVCTSPPLLATSDEPVVPLEGPGATRDERGGVGSARIVIYPLAPTRLLAMVRPDIAQAWGIGNHTDRVYHDELDSVEILEVAHELIAHSTRYVVERPKRQLGLRLQVGPLPGQAQFEEVATLREGDREGSLMRLFKRNRWSTAARVPPWPVARWWEASRR